MPSVAETDMNLEQRGRSEFLDIVPLAAFQPFSAKGEHCSKTCSGARELMRDSDADLVTTNISGNTARGGLSTIRRDGADESVIVKLK